MSEKRSARKRKTPSPSLKMLIIFLSVFAAATAFLIFYLLKSSRTPVSRPAYEEIFLAKTDLDQKIIAVENSIYESLYRSGVNEKDVLFLDVHFRRRNDHTWEFAELLVKSENRQATLHLRKKMEEALVFLGLGTQVRQERVPQNRLQMISHVFVGPYHTHKVIFSYETPLKGTPKTRPKINIIIDDLGYDRTAAGTLMNMGVPFTFSILPSAPFTVPIVRNLKKKGYELLLHLPMEPKEYPSVNPGSDALLLSMADEQILKRLRRHLAEIPGAKGINNHMGSSFTEDEKKMSVVLEELKRRNLFYIDSRTSSKTVGLDMAKKLGLPSARRDVFIDYAADEKIIKRQMERLLSKARHSGKAIGIAHPHQETLQVLKEYVSVINEDFDLVTSSEMVH